MTSAGNPNTAVRRLLILGAFGALGLGAFSIGISVLSILYGVLFPPMPPLPKPSESLTQLAYESTSYGVDDWLYSVPIDACEVAVFYADQNPLCPIPPFCNDNSVVNGLERGATLGRCSADVQFSSFMMRWQVIIGVDNQDVSKTVLRLTREVFWGGQIPPSFESLMPTEFAP